jgi:hypothetical protein
MTPPGRHRTAAKCASTSPCPIDPQVTLRNDVKRECHRAQIMLLLDLNPRKQASIEPSAGSPAAGMTMWAVANVGAFFKRSRSRHRPARRRSSFQQQERRAEVEARGQKHGARREAERRPERHPPHRHSAIAQAFTRQLSATHFFRCGHCPSSMPRPLRRTRRCSAGHTAPVIGRSAEARPTSPICDRSCHLGSGGRPLCIAACIRQGTASIDYSSSRI